MGGAWWLAVSVSDGAANRARCCYSSLDIFGGETVKFDELVALSHRMRDEGAAQAE